MFSQEHETFYNTKRWRRHAAAIMSANGYIDQVEKRYGKMVPAEVVHHALPLEDYPQYAWESWNNIPVSRKTHRALHNDDGTLSRQGVELAVRTARRAGVEYHPPERDAGRGRQGRARGVPGHYATSSH